jgi:hypothetical protein
MHEKRGQESFIDGWAGSRLTGGHKRLPSPFSSKPGIFGNNALLSTRTTSMNKLITYAGAGLLGLAASAFSAEESKGDIIQFGNQSAPETAIGGGSAVLDNNYNAGSGVTPEYDVGVDGLLDTSINPNSQFFVTYFPMVDGGGNDVAVDYNFAPFPNIGDSYTARLGFEDRLGTGAYAPNYIKFDDFIISNPNGVTDFAYDLSVDTDWDGSRDHFESGLVSELWATPDQKTGSWNQFIHPGFNWDQGFYYGSLTLTAVGEISPIPEPSSVVLMGGLFVAGAAGAGISRLRRKRKDKDSKK